MSRISIPKNCSLDVRLAIQQIAAELHEKKSPTFAGLNLSGLTASRLIQTNISKVLSSVTDLTSWIAGTANQISVADDADGTVTLAIINPLKLSYDATNYITFAVQSDGDLTLDSNKVSYDLNFVDGNLLTTGTLGAGAITTEGKITVTGGGETGTFQTGLGRYTVLAYTGLGLDIRAGNGNNASQNVMRVDNSGNFDFYSGNLVTLGTLGAGVTTIESTTTPQLTIKYDASNLGSIEIISGGDMYLRGGTDFRFIGTDGSGAAVILYDDTSSVARLGHSGTSGNCAFYNYYGSFQIRNTNAGDIGFYTDNTLRMTVWYAALGGHISINNDLHIGSSDRPTLALDVYAKCGMSQIGGACVKLTNKTGSNTVAGQLVIASTGTADAFATAGASSDAVIGIVLDAGVADGSEAWVVVAGIADVLIDGGGSTIGDRMISSATAGSADVWNTGGAVATHFLEIGHCIETRVGAGLARCVLHFN